MRRIIIGAVFIIFMLGAGVSAASNIEVYPGTPASRNMLDYIEGFAGELPRAGYVCLVRSDGKNIGVAYIFDFRNSRACRKVYKAFIAKNSSMGAAAFITIKGFSKIAVMEKIDSAASVAQRGNRLIYSNAQNKDAAVEAVSRARVKREGIKKAVSAALLFIVTAVIFILVKFFSSARKIKESMKIKICFEKKDAPKIKFHWQD